MPTNSSWIACTLGMMAIVKGSNKAEKDEPQDNGSATEVELHKHFIYYSTSQQNLLLCQSSGAVTSRASCYTCFIYL